MFVRWKDEYDNLTDVERCRQRSRTRPKGLWFDEKIESTALPRSFVLMPLIQYLQYTQDRCDWLLGLMVLAGERHECPQTLAATFSCFPATIMRTASREAFLEQDGPAGKDKHT
jgi:hypothetical protein